MPGILVLTGLNSADFSWVNFATSGGNFLVAANGVDSVLNYNGAAWSNPAITGVTSSTLEFVWAFKSRLYFLQKNTSKAWFLPVDSVAGAAVALNIGAELNLGGRLVAGGSLTYDGGFGPDDLWVVISEEGEVIIYSGSDPTSATDWSLVGTFRVGRPIGNRCLLKIGGDLAVLTQDGVISLSNSLKIDRAAEQQAAFTGRIRKAFADQYALTGTEDGWQIMTWAAGHYAFVNIPISTGNTYYQYVMNVLTGAWTRYTGVNATCWATLGDALYFGTSNGYVMEFGIAGSDFGESINALCVAAFNNMKRPGFVKHVKSARVLSRATGAYQIGLNVAVDFTVTDLAVSSIGFSGGGGGSALWDTAVWDVSVWGGVSGTLVNGAWMGVSSMGYYLAAVILTQANEPTPSAVEFISMDMTYELGSPLG